MFLRNIRSAFEAIALDQNNPTIEPSQQATTNNEPGSDGDATPTVAQEVEVEAVQTSTITSTIPDDCSQQNKEAVFASIIEQLTNETDDQDWIRKLCVMITNRYVRMPRGWWPRIRTEHNTKFNTNTSLDDIKNLYSRFKRVEYRNNDNQPQHQAGTSQQTSQQAEDRSAGHVQHNVPRTIKNVDLFVRVSEKLRQNFNEYRGGDQLRLRTKRIYSFKLDHDFIDILNQVIKHQKLDQEADSIAEVNDLMYACQLTYEEMHTKPKATSPWKESIEKKIRYYEAKCKILEEYEPGSRPSKQVMQECARQGIHTCDRSAMELTIDELRQTIKVYQKKIEVAQKRKQFHYDNKRFEFNRSAFYRNFREDGSVSNEIKMEEVTKYWQAMWARAEQPTDYRQMVNIAPCANLEIEVSEEKIKSYVAEAIKSLPPWKAPGPDGVYNFFIKKMISVHDRLAHLMSLALQSPELIDPRLYIGNTHMVPKTREAKVATDLRPITCLPNIFKIGSKVIMWIMREWTAANAIISTEQ